MEGTDGNRYFGADNWPWSDFEPKHIRIKEIL